VIGSLVGLLLMGLAILGVFMIIKAADMPASDDEAASILGVTGFIMAAAGAFLGLIIVGCNVPVLFAPEGSVVQNLLTMATK
jgi:hypothetical protein